MKEMDLAGMIIGRVDPHIYAFETGAVPGHLKVGDTFRPVPVRLGEWREQFPDLEKRFAGPAKVGEDVYFRDHAVHSFLEREKGRARLGPGAFPAGLRYSREFFGGATAGDIEEAVRDIRADGRGPMAKYRFYRAETRLPKTYAYPRTETYGPRPNQAETIERYKHAVAAGRTNLLMYAVMRFGKTFTAMCCAQETGARTVVVVSAKADVLDEWKKTVESHVRFCDYAFLTGESLLADEGAVRGALAADKRAVVFLTLQDLQGAEIKEKHAEVFRRPIDLLIIDETHFGARAEKYGQVLRALGREDARAIRHKKDADDFIETSEADERIKKALRAKVRLHLSGTPYRILMGSEFSREDVIAFYQFTDIVRDQAAWDREHLRDDDCREWDNPYYGFPQMIRFAFRPNESSRRKLKELRDRGVPYALSALLRPKSIRKAGGGSEFIHEREVLELLEAIDGVREDDGLFGFLDYGPVKEGRLCRHIVCVLPYCASCDAMEALIRKNRGRFRNLGGFEIVNISGLDVPPRFGSPRKVAAFIRQCEDAGKKTLTLTVNRMLTGSTVEEWDAMIFLKDTASPQEYDQAVFRLQNRFVRKLASPDGDEIQCNRKPQTLLVDFDPDRMFSMQERRAQIYNANVDEAGNRRLEERIEEELRISPIIAGNRERMSRVEAADILAAVSEYSRSRGVAEETLEIPVDLSLLDNPLIRRAVGRENELGAGAGLTLRASAGPETGLDVPAPGPGAAAGRPAPGGAGAEGRRADPVRQFRSYYARILFFAFLTPGEVHSLEDILAKFRTSDNARIAKNLGLSRNVLSCILKKINTFVLRELDYKILNLNRLSRDASVSPVERARVAVRKFGRLGKSEIVTPKEVCDGMVALFPDTVFADAVRGGGKILDIAGKTGEFALAIAERCEKLGYGAGRIRNAVYTIPTSGIAYEFTRKVYESLGLDVSGIAARFTSYDLLNVRGRSGRMDNARIRLLLTQRKPFNKITLDDPVREGDGQVKFEMVTGNPPYQESLERTSDRPVYHLFLDAAFTASDRAMFITPARFLFNAGKTPKEWNRRILNDGHFKVVWYRENSADVFPDVDIKGGVAVTYRDAGQDFGGTRVYTAFPELNAILGKVRGGRGFSCISPLIHLQTKFNLKALYGDFPGYRALIGSGGRERRLTTSIFERLALFTAARESGTQSGVLGLAGNRRVTKYIERKYIEPQGNLMKYKVIIPKSNGAGAFGEPLSSPVIGGPGVGHTQSFISIGAFDTEAEAAALLKYVKGKFSRCMLGTLKVTQDNNKQTWENVPLQDFTPASDIDWTRPVPEIDRRLYAKYGLTAGEIAFIEKKIKPME